MYKTTVNATVRDVTIVEFGAFVWKEGKWVNGATFTGKPYAAEEFAEWYKCPKALLKKGVITRPMVGYGFPQALRISVGVRGHNERLVSGLREILS